MLNFLSVWPLGRRTGQAATRAPLQYGQDKRLADFAERNAFRRFLQGRFETLDWFPERLEAQSESLMVHWHDELRASLVGHLHRFFRTAMSPDPRVVTSN